MSSNIYQKFPPEEIFKKPRSISTSSAQSSPSGIFKKNLGTPRSNSPAVQRYKFALPELGKGFSDSIALGRTQIFDGKVLNRHTEIINPFACQANNDNDLAEKQLGIQKEEEDESDRPKHKERTASSDRKEGKALMAAKGKTLQDKNKRKQIPPRSPEKRLRAKTVDDTVDLAPSQETIEVDLRQQDLIESLAGVGPNNMQQIIGVFTKRRQGNQSIS